MACPFCKRTDTDGLYCDDDHCRELPRVSRPRPRRSLLASFGQAFPPATVPRGRCWSCNAVLPDVGECTDPDCIRCD